MALGDGKGGNSVLDRRGGVCVQVSTKKPYSQKAFSGFISYRIIKETKGTGGITGKLGQKKIADHIWSQ